MRDIASPRGAALLAVLYLATVVVAVNGQEIDGVIYPPDVFRAIISIDDAGPPVVLQNDVIFTYRSRGFVRYVAASFTHEGYQQLHTYSARPSLDGDLRDEVFFLVYPVDRRLSEQLEDQMLQYRIVVDGVWLVDPYAPDRVIDPRGIPIGQVRVRDRPITEFSSPRIRADGTVQLGFSYDRRIVSEVTTHEDRTFSITVLPRQTPMVVGSFNGWDPFVAPMVQDPQNPDNYFLNLRLPPGSHYYYYLIGGERILDPTNPEIFYDSQTNANVSRLIVPRSSR